MDGLIAHYFPFVFPAIFLLMWLVITSFLGFLSGWYSLMGKYPNWEEKILLQLKRQSGSMDAG